MYVGVKLNRAEINRIRAGKPKAGRRIIPIARETHVGIKFEIREIHYKLVLGI